MITEKKAAPKRRRSTATGSTKPRTTRARKTAAAEPDAPVEADAPAEPVAPPALVPPTIVTTIPEVGFAARRPAPAAPRPMPERRRGVFFDVENTSRPEDAERVLLHLGLDYTQDATELFAIGNWRVIGHETARLLASRGAQLVHSAPSTGVRDWSDLRIAVAAGVWLAAARPGDSIEIVSDDQAFDAVGDVAMSLGVSFHRLSYRRLAGLAMDVPAEERRADDAHRRRRGNRRGGRTVGQRGGRSEHRHVEHAHGGHAHERRERPAPAPVEIEVGEAHAASEAEIVDVVRQLCGVAPNGATTLDALSNALKARGYRRPPGSLRLVTRVRRIKEIDVGRNGLVRLREGDVPLAVEFQPAAIEDEPVRGDPLEPYEAAEADDVEGDADDGDELVPDDGAPERGGSATPPVPARRRRRRGGRRRRGRGRAAGVAAPS